MPTHTSAHDGVSFYVNVTEWTSVQVTTFMGWEAISIRNYQNADARPPQWTSNAQPIVSINCPDVVLGGTSCVLSNLIIDGAQQGVGGHPAVRVIR